MNKNIFKMMIRVKLIHWVGIVLATLLWGTFAMVNPARNYYKKVDANMAVAEHRYKKTAEATEGIKDFDLEITKKKEMLEVMEGRLLASGEQAQVIALVVQATEELGISIQNITPIEAAEVPSDDKSEKDEEQKGLKATQFNIEMVCRYKALGLFFEHLESQELLISVDSFQIEPQADQPEFLTVAMKLAAYEKMT